ncbi:beta-L-arabinofuranosidase [Bacteroides acidifaciens]|uniref:Glycosyl hydrolase n=4 Tax=Bacteroides acidifaciens TaxID=85831 RepID=A0A3L8AGH2_9BACE|nr:glycoside hydrolase family 127 protein [Bacteroides acidifaciens]MCR1997663.1 glycoside hydrolase family 127 protein [Bacteroides acidifaciens]RLT81713.1 glycosyl hydrolase [Bacteroides acidifaciens]GFH84996.1 non-reducing end beta-L-arabinofuranosidase [Bacteroides acidifaciens]
MKTTSFILALLLSVSLGKAQNRQQVSYFPLQDVKLLNSPFLQAQQTDLHYILSMNPDRLLAPFLREAGLTPKAPSYTNWENTGLDGHIGGHYLSALSMMYAATGDTAVYNRLNYMLNELHRAQQAVGTGFIGGTPNSLQLWKDIKAGNIRAGGFDLNGKWVPLYNIHKTYAGLRDAYLYAGSDLARQMLVDFTDWMIDITSDLSDEQIQDMLRSEHGGLNETFADVAEITGDKKYLELARRFSHKFILDPLIKEEDKLTGMHANTQIPKVIGYKRIAELSQDDKNWNHAAEWDHAARFFWNTVVNHRSVCIGGNSVREHFHPSDNFTSMLNDVQGPETCNTYNMLRLTKMLYQDSPETNFADYYERALYNHILASQEPEKGGFVYFTPMRPGHYRVYSQPETSMWCCVGSGLENHTKYGEFIYAHQKDTLYVNLFIPSQLTWKEKGVTLTQETRFPDDGKVTLRIDKAPKKGITLKIRQPQWTGHSKEYNVKINGKNEASIVEENSNYLTLHRKWKKGDVITFNLPMKVSLEQIPDKKDYYAFLYGPIVLAASTGTGHLDGLYADDSRGGHIAHGKQIPLQEVPMLIGNPESIRNSLHKKDDNQLIFTFDGNVYPAQNKTLELIPFFRLHNARYAIYFRQANEEQFKIIQKEMATAERKATELANQTVDLIFPGEQQPESDHGIQYEQAETGTNKDRHFRRAKGWFSYNLKVKEEAGRIRITIQKNDRNKVAILLNNNKLAVNPTISEADKDGFITLSWLLPQKLKSGSCPIRFTPDGTEWTPAIYEVRLLK